MGARGHVPIGVHHDVAVTCLFHWRAGQLVERQPDLEAEFLARDRQGRGLRKLGLALAGPHAEVLHRQAKRIHRGGRVAPSVAHRDLAGSDFETAEVNGTDVLETVQDGAAIEEAVARGLEFDFEVVPLLIPVVGVVEATDLNGVTTDDRSALNGADSDAVGIDDFHHNGSAGLVTLGHNGSTQGIIVRVPTILCSHMATPEARTDGPSWQSNFHTRHVGVERRPLQDGHVLLAFELDPA